MSKSADAFRTISEVADWLGIPAHVLRFWESKFTQVKPVKRAGGRRYYRPADMQLLGGIRKLLHDEGMTIKGVQKVMRDQGVRHVAAMSPPLDDDLEEAIAGIALDVPEPEEPRGTVLSFNRLKADAPAACPADQTAPDDSQTPDSQTPDLQTPDSAEAAPDDRQTSAAIPSGDAAQAPIVDSNASENQIKAAETPTASQATDNTPPEAPAAAAIPAKRQDPPAPDSTAPAEPAPAPASTEGPDTPTEPELPHAPAAKESASAGSSAQDAAEDAPAPPKAEAPAAEDSDAPASQSAIVADAPDAADVAPRVAKVTVPDDPADDTPAAASALAHLAMLTPASLAAQRPALSDLAGRIAKLRARMTGGAKSS